MSKKAASVLRQGTPPTVEDKETKEPKETKEQPEDSMDLVASDEEGGEFSDDVIDVENPDPPLKKLSATTEAKVIASLKKRLETFSKHLAGWYKDYLYRMGRFEQINPNNNPVLWKRNAVLNDLAALSLALDLKAPLPTSPYAANTNRFRQ